MATAPDKLLEMSDDEFGNLSTPPAEVPAGEADQGNASGAEAAPGADPLVPAPEDDDAGATDAGTNEDGASSGSDADEGADEGGEADPTADPKAPEGAKNEPADDARTQPVKVGTQSFESLDAMKVEDKAAAFNHIMKPFKANGKTIELRSPEEAIQLMQMGANYTKKLQDLQPHRKMIMMLENNGLLDEGKLSFLIDLERREPEAIKKLLKDGGIDPMDIDTTTAPNYIAGSHTVTDAEANFQTTLDELSSNPTGIETLRTINTDWDADSKQAIFASPQIMTLIHEQRESGAYAIIAAEVARQRTLGTIPATTPFLQAYKEIGDAMAQQAIGTQSGQASTGNAGSGDKPKVLGTRVAAPKSSVTNGDKAGAAAPSRGSPRTAEVKTNPLAEADDVFLKQMENRL